MIRFPSNYRFPPRGAVLVLLALLVGVLTTFGAAQAANPRAGVLAKPGPDAVPATAGAAIIDNALSAKQGVAALLPTSTPAGKAHSIGVLPALTGYVVNSSEFVNPAGSQSFGKVDCPLGTVAFGGGVLGNSDSLYQNVNSSYPRISGSVATGWGGYVDNASNDDAVFLVYVVCAKKPANYAVVSATFDNPAGTQTSGNVACPIGSTGVQMKPFGGGAIGSSSGLGENINTSIPVKSTRSWRADMNNASGTDAKLTVYAVCGLRSGWTVVKGAAVTNAANIQTSAGIGCTAGLTSVGGGLFSSSANTAVNLNGTYPDSSSSWLSYENNASSGNPTITPYVVCLS
jgi:hypothetical protein